MKMSAAPTQDIMRQLGDYPFLQQDAESLSMASA